LCAATSAAVRYLTVRVEVYGLRGLQAPTVFLIDVMSRRYFVQRQHIIASVCLTLSILDECFYNSLEARHLVVPITCTIFLPIAIFISVVFQTRCSIYLLKTTRAGPGACFALLLRYLLVPKPTKLMYSLGQRRRRRSGDYP
jgi:hypothetical protein